MPDWLALLVARCILGVRGVPVPEQPPAAPTAPPSINLVGEWLAFGPPARALLDFSGETDCRGQGYGTAVTRLMPDYPFTMLVLYNPSSV